MKCPFCGAEVGSETKCPYCDSVMPVEMKKEIDEINKQRCAKCGSSNIVFQRENQGMVRGKNSYRNLNTTIGVCRDCGYTWYPSDGSKKKSNNLVWWILGWIFIFPIPLTILMVRKKDMKLPIRIAIIAIGWIVYYIIFVASG